MKKFFGLLVVFSSLTLGGCTSTTPVDTPKVLDDLPINADFEAFGNISDVMDAGGCFCKNPNARISVYQYESSSLAAEKFACISPDGSYIKSNNTIYTPEWSQSAHFYLCENQIIAYYGSDQNLLDYFESKF